MTASSQPRARLGFFNRDDRLTFIGSAIQAGVMWKFQLMTLRTHGQTRGGQFLVCPPLIPARSCVPTFRICHRGSSSVARVASPGSMTPACATGARCLGFSRRAIPWSAASRVVVTALLQFPQDPEWICEPLFGAPTGTSISILPAGWTESLAIFTAEGLEWHPQDDLLP